MPVGAWLKAPLRSWAADLLSESRLNRQNLLDVQRVQSCWQDHLSGNRDHSRMLWAVLMLQSWLGMMVEQSTSPIDRYPRARTVEERAMEALVGRRIRSLQALSPDMAEDELGRRLTEQSLASNDGLQSLNRVLDSVRKYRRLVVRMIVVGALLAGEAGLLMSPSYLATAQLAVDVRQSGAVDALNAGGASAAPTPAAEESTIDTHVTVLLSDAYLRRLLPTLRALEDARHGAETGSRTWMQSLRTLFGRTWSATKELLLGKNHEPDDGSASRCSKAQLEGWSGAALQNHRRYFYGRQSATSGGNRQYGGTIVCRRGRASEAKRCGVCFELPCDTIIQSSA